ncbi:LYSM4 protein, partial [Pomatorhinus ruficollis]|nr:LYSM4 protein [Pomatorhinus ruficollis]
MRLHESRTRPFQAPASVHTFPGRQVFVFPDGRSESEESSEEELNVMELRPRGKEQQRGSTRGRLGDVVLLERELTQEDSLNKLALQYGCKVRAVPTEGFHLHHKVSCALLVLTLGSVGPVCCMDGHCLGRAGERKKKKKPRQTQKRVVQPTTWEDYFRGIDQSIQDAVQVEVQLNAEYGGEGLERPLPEAGKRDAGNGADCGIQWWNAVFIMLLIGIVLPVFYIIYFKTQGLVAHTANTTVSNVSAAGLEGKLPQDSVVGKKS